MTHIFTRSRRWIVGAASLIAAAVLTAWGWPARSYLDWDFFPFWIAARLLLAGSDPYDPRVLRDAFLEAGSQGYAFGGAFAYPLPTLILTIPFALLPFGSAAALWLVSQVALGGVALWTLARRLFGNELRRDGLVLVALVLSMPATLHTIGIGNVGGFLLAIAAGALVLLLDDRPLLAGATLGLAIFKPHPFVLLIPLVLAYSPRRGHIALGGLATSIPLTAVALAIRPSWPGEWLTSLTALGSIDVAHANVWGPFPADQRWLGWVVLAVLLCGFIAWWRWARPAITEHYAAALALSLLATPYVWTHYHVMLGAAMAVVIALAPHRGVPRAAFLATLALTTVLLPWILYVDTFRTGSEPFGGIAPFGLLLLTVALTTSRGRP